MLVLKFLLRDADMHSAYTCYGDVAGWLGGWLSVTRRYCIKTAKPILKLFRPSGSPIILSSSNHAPIPNCKGNPFSGAVNTQGEGKISDFRAIFDANRRLSSIFLMFAIVHIILT